MDNGYKRLPQVNREIKKLRNERKAFDRARTRVNDDAWYFSNVNGIDAMIARKEVEKAEIEARGWVMFKDGTAVIATA